MQMTNHGNDACAGGRPQALNELFPLQKWVIIEPFMSG